MTTFLTSSIQPLGIIVAVIVDMIIGFLWYSPLLFVKPWMQDIGMTEEKMKQKGATSMASGIIVSLVASIVFTFLYAHMLSFLNVHTVGDALLTGLVFWFTFFGLITFVHYNFQGSPKRLWFITAGHELVKILAISIVLALI